MALSLSGIRFTLQMTATYQNTLTDGNVSSVKHPSLNYNPSLNSGIGDNQANRGWQDKDRTLLSGVSEVLDLFDLAGIDIGGGAGKDGLGQDVLFEEIVGIAVVNENAITAVGQLEVEPDASNGWTPIGIHTVVTKGALRGQGMICKGQVSENGFDVADASNHRIKFTANGGDVNYSIYLLCRHDDEESSSSSSSESSSTSSSSSSISTSSQSSSTSSASSSSWSSQFDSSASSSSLSTSSVSSQSSSSWSSPS